MQKNKQTVCTAALIVINMGIFFLLSFLGNPENAVFMIKYGAMYPPLIFEDAQYYRLITCIFLHFGIDHLMNNMVMLGALGWNLEKEIGSFKFCERDRGKSDFSCHGFLHWKSGSLSRCIRSNFWIARGTSVGCDS